MDTPLGRQTDSNTLPSNGFRLITLGALKLVDRHGETDQALAKRRRKLAVLAVLGLSRRPTSRDRLAEMFWGDEEETRKRHSLSDALSNLRRVLGPESITTRQFDVTLSPACELTIDALELVEAAQQRDHARVVALYQGPFLGSLEVAPSTTFDQWASRIGEELRRHWLDACSHQCLSLARARKWDECAILARRWLDADPKSADSALYVLNALKAPGTVEAYQSALDEYAMLEQRLDREFHQTPSPDVAQLAASIREKLNALRKEVAATPPVVIPSEARNPHRPEREPSVGRMRIPRLTARDDTSRYRSRLAAIPLAASLFLSATSFTFQTERPQRTEGSRPSVAIVDIRNLSGDSATAWLELGLPQLVGTEIARLPEIEVVSPERIRQAREALDLPRGATVNANEIRQVGARSGAAWVVSGSILRGYGVYALDMTVRDTAGETSPQRFTITGASLIALADQAAAKLARYVGQARLPEDAEVGRTLGALMR
jgi:DNA-binding SARP family transcriptional activator/TolB-like protein